MVGFPQHGACLCGEVEYKLERTPLTLYACHCTDCQRQTGASFALYMVSRREDFAIVRGQPGEHLVELADGRRKESSVCRRCHTRLWGPSSSSELVVLEAGTLNDTSWLRPVAHIWTRSAQPWVQLPHDSLKLATQPQAHDWLAIVRAWQAPPSGASGHGS